MSDKKRRSFGLDGRGPVETGRPPRTTKHVARSSAKRPRPQPRPEDCPLVGPERSAAALDAPETAAEPEADVFPDPRMAAVVVAYSAGAVSIREAAAAARVPRTTLQDWLRRCDAGDPDVQAFGQAVMTAQVEASNRYRTKIEAAADTSWQAAAKLLDRHDAMAKDPVQDAYEGMSREEAIAAFAQHPEVRALVLAQAERERLGSGGDSHD